MLDAQTALERQQLYNEGLADTAIARRQGVDRTAIRDWRRRNGLSPNPPGRRVLKTPRKPGPSPAKPKELQVRQCHLAPDDATKRLELYNAGMSDLAIAAAVGIRANGVFEWRKREGLPANFPRGRNSTVNPALAIATPDLKRRVLALFGRGVGARIIAREMHASLKTLERWRTTMLRKQPELRRPNIAGRRTPRHPNGRAYSKMLPERRARAFVLYADGKDDGEIAREMGLYRRQIWEWRHALFLPAIGTAWRNRTAKPKARPIGPAITPMSNPLYAHIATAIGRALPRDLIDDAVSDMWLAIAEGRLSIDQVAEQANRFRNRTLASYASKFGPQSIDEDLGDGEGFRLVDLIRDDRSRDWLEEMGATVW